MKILADDDLDAVLSLVGVPGGAQEMDSALPGSLMRADLPARTSSGIVHVEFVKDRSPDLDLRMMTYRLRMRRQEGDRHTPIAQYVLVLSDTITVPDRYAGRRCRRGVRLVGRWCGSRTWVRRRCWATRPRRRSRRWAGAPRPSGSGCSSRPRS